MRKQETDKTFNILFAKKQFFLYIRKISFRLQLFKQIKLQELNFGPST